MKAILGFDMESDIGSWTTGYEGIKHATPKLIDLLGMHDVKATFFWVAQAAVDNPESVRLVADTGHEIGSHSLFHETVGDPLFPVPGVNPILESELPERLRLAHKYIQETCDAIPRSFRAPRLFGGTKLINTLEQLGYLVDASYPLYFYREQLSPYRPSSTDWTKRGDMRLLEIPNFADITAPTTDPYHRDQDQWPLFRTKGSAQLLHHIRNFLALLDERGEERVLCFYFHPWEFVEMPQGEIFVGEGWVRPHPFIVENCGDYALQQLDILIQSLKTMGFTFTTCIDYALARGTG